MAHEPEPPFNPCDQKLPDNEQVFACRWELLRRNQQFRAVAEKWIASESFRKAHALTAEYRHFVRMVPCCALDWMLTPKQRLDLARFQIEMLTWKRNPHPNFGPIICCQKSLARLSRENVTDFVELRQMKNAPEPVTPDRAWNNVPEPFKHQFRYAVLPSPLKPAFDSINKTIADTSRDVLLIARKLALGDKLGEMEGMIQRLLDRGFELHHLSNYFALYRIARGGYSNKTFNGYLERIKKDFSGAYGEIYATTKYDRHRSFLGTTEDWHWFLEAERRGLDIKKYADLYALAELYCENLRSRVIHGQAPRHAQAHGHTGTPFLSKYIKARRPAVRRHVLKIEEWIRTEYLPLPSAPSKIVS